LAIICDLYNCHRHHYISSTVNITVLPQDSTSDRGLKPFKTDTFFLACPCKQNTKGCEQTAVAKAYVTTCNVQQI